MAHPFRGAVLRLAAVATLAKSLLSACTPIGVLDTLSSRSGYERTTDIAYGPLPRQKLDIYRPEGVAGPAPVVVFFYGGGWHSGERANYRFAAQAFASSGFLTVVPDYRLVPAVHFPTFLEDSAAAVAWVAANIRAHGGDPGRLFLAGHSAGAYNAAMLTLDQRYLRQAGADPDIVKGFVGLAGPYDFLPLDVAASINAFGQAEDKAATQPVNFVRPDAPPILLLHGEADQTVFLHNPRNLAAALREKGAPVEVKLYPGLGHIGIVLALSSFFRGKAPILADAVAFLRGLAEAGSGPSVNRADKGR